MQQKCSKIMIFCWRNFAKNNAWFMKSFFPIYFRNSPPFSQHFSKITLAALLILWMIKFYQTITFYLTEWWWCSAVEELHWQMALPWSSWKTTKWSTSQSRPSSRWWELSPLRGCWWKPHSFYRFSLLFYVSLNHNLMTDL